MQNILQDIRIDYENFKLLSNQAHVRGSCTELHVARQGKLGVTWQAEGRWGG